MVAIGHVTCQHIDPKTNPGAPHLAVAVGFAAAALFFAAAVGIKGHVVPGVQHRS